MATVLKSGLWRTIGLHLSNEHQHAIFQPAGGMDMITRGFEKHVGQFVRPNSKVTAILQDDTGVKVDYLDTQTGEKLSAAADYCICTIPLSILSQIEMNVGAPLAAAIAAVPYRPSVKVGIEFKRRFWEQDEEIYGGITSTDLPISQISYPSDGYGSQGPRGAARRLCWWALFLRADLDATGRTGQEGDGDGSGDPPAVRLRI